MFQLRHRGQQWASNALWKSGSMDDVKVPRTLPLDAQSPSELIVAACFSR